MTSDITSTKAIILHDATMPSRRREAWVSALTLGLISGTFSTLVITLGAPRIGRSRGIDWMDIGTVAIGATSISAPPDQIDLLAGVLVHQTADLWWAVVLFALLRRWMLDRGPWAIALIGLPWAVLTSALEYYAFLPVLQPLVPLEVPYWTALGVHVTSAVAYPLFPYIRAWKFARPMPHPAAARWTIGAMGGLAVVLLSLEGLAAFDREPAWAFSSASAVTFDREFMPAMVEHHRLGIRMGQAMLDHGGQEDTRALAMLIVAEQTAEIDLLQSWWRSWFGGSMPSVPHERIPGMSMSGLSDGRSEQAFLRHMIAHHRGAVQMTARAEVEAGDPRLRTFAISVGHAQQGQIAWMQTLVGERADRRPRMNPVWDILRGE